MCSAPVAAGSQLAPPPPATAVELLSSRQPCTVQRACRHSEASHWSAQIYAGLSLVCWRRHALLHQFPANSSKAYGFKAGTGLGEEEQGVTEDVIGYQESGETFEMFQHYGRST